MASFYDRRLEIPRTRNVKEVEGFLRQVYKDWLTYTTNIRQLWRFCDAYVNGLQWAVFDYTGSSLVVPQLPTGRRRVTDDKIGPWALDLQAKLTLKDPTVEVIPNSMNVNDKKSASVGDKFASHYWDVLKFKGAYGSLIQGILPYGAMYYDLDVDPRGGPRFILPDGGVSESAEIKGNILTPFSVIDDCTAEALNDKYWYMTVTWETIDYLSNRYGKDVPPEVKARDTDEHFAMMRTLVSGQGVYLPRVTSNTEGSLTYRFFMRPQRKLDKGFYIAIANGVELERGDWTGHLAKMTHGNPITEFYWLKRTGKRFGVIPVDMQLNLQRENNRTKSQIAEAVAKMTSLKWMNPIGSLVNDMSDLNGEMVRYRPGFMPTQNVPSPMPQQVYRHIEMLESSFQDVQFRHQATKAVSPPNVRSAVGLARLQEQDDRPLSVPEKNLEESLASVFTKVLQIASVIVDTPRAIHYTGRNDARSVEQFRGVDLNDNTTVSVRIISGISRSPAATIEMMMELFRIGAYRTPDGRLDSAGFLELIKYAVPGSQFDEIEKHRSIQRQENDVLWSLLENPQQIIPSPQVWQRHDIHLREIEDEMNSVEWITTAEQESQRVGNKVEASPFLMGWIGHRQTHINFLYQAMQAAGQPASVEESAPPDQPQ